MVKNLQNNVPQWKIENPLNTPSYIVDIIFKRAYESAEISEFRG